MRGAVFVVNAIQVGGYDPATITDFEIPKKYGLRQTIADTIGIGGVMRALRTIPVMEEFAKVMERVCPNALLLNYSNPMAMLTSYMLRYTDVKTVGLCHSVQICSETLLKGLGMEDKLEGRVEYIAGINHMAWLLSLHDKDGNDLYRRSRELHTRTQLKSTMTWSYEYIKHLGYYCTESVNIMPNTIRSSSRRAIRVGRPIQHSPGRDIQGVHPSRSPSGMRSGRKSITGGSIGP